MMLVGGRRKGDCLAKDSGRDASPGRPVLGLTADAAPMSQLLPTAPPPPESPAGPVSPVGPVDPVLPVAPVLPGGPVTLMMCGDVPALALCDWLSALRTHTITAKMAATPNAMYARELLMLRWGAIPFSSLRSLAS
jgi:hypothetical protein